MGKRSNFTRNARDFYPTPIKAVEPLIDHLPYEDFTYIEPCAGDGRLVNHISELTDGSGLCVYKSDIEPQADDVEQGDALRTTVSGGFTDFCITNPPWNTDFLHPFLEHYAVQMPTWVLNKADWMHTKKSAEYMPFCKKVVSIGRVKWIEGSESTSLDNSCWYLFDYNHEGPTEFYGRLL